MIKTRPRPKHENTTTSKLVTTCDNCVCNWFAHALGLVHWWDFSRNVGEKLQNQPEGPNYGLPGLSYRPYRPALDNANVPYKATFAEMLGKKRCHSEGAPTFMPVWGSATWQPILEYTMLLCLVCSPCFRKVCCSQQIGFKVEHYWPEWKRGHQSVAVRTSIPRKQLQSG
jgi:hypothetical protein